MITKIKHIISLIVATSLLALTFISCAQPTTPEVEAEKFTVKFSSEHGTKPKDLLVEKDYELKESDIEPLSDDNYNFLGWFIGETEIKAGYKVTKNVTLEAKWKIKALTVSSIELDKTRALYSDKLDKVTVTIRGTDFKQLKDNLSKKLQYNVYSIGDDSSTKIEGPLDLVINYDTNTATSVYTLPNLENEEQSGMPYILENTKYNFVPVINGEEIDKKVELLITDKPILLFDQSFFLEDESLKDNTIGKTDTTKKVELGLYGNALDYLNKIEVKILNSKEVQVGQTVIEDLENFKSQLLMIPLTLPAKEGDYTIKLYFNDILQETYFAPYSYEYVSFTNNILHVLGDPVISSLSILGVGTGGEKTFDFIINGSNFTNTDGINITYVENPDFITDATFDILSKTQIKATINKPTTGGNHTIKVTLNGNEVTGEATFRDTSSFIIGDILLKNGTIIKPDELTDSNKSEAVGVIAGFNSNGIPFALSVQNVTDTAWAKSGSTGRNKRFDAIVCNCSDGATTKKDLSTVTGDFNGSDNWEEILKVDTNAENNNRENYPAFSFAKTMGEGWYIPTLVELFSVTPNQKVIEDSLKLIDPDQTLVGYYWTSSQESFAGYLAWYVNFADNINDSSFSSNDKSYGYSVRCIKLL